MPVEALLSSSTPAIDKKLGLALANNKAEVAEELLTKFIKHLPESHKRINEAYLNNDLNELAHQIHKLHGACCYCGVPRLKEVIDTFESALKQNKLQAIEKIMDLLNEAIDDVFDAFENR